MTYPERVLCALERLLKIQPVGCACQGCGQEHSCSVHGCAIIREAMSLIEALLMQREEKCNG